MPSEIELEKGKLRTKLFGYLVGAVGFGLLAVLAILAAVLALLSGEALAAVLFGFFSLVSLLVCGWLVKEFMRLGIDLAASPIGDMGER